MTDQQKKDIIKQFVDYVKGELNIEQLPTIHFTSERDWALTRHSFGQYSPDNKHLDVYIGNRNMADILRTLGHELVHHRQHELGIIKGNNDGRTGSPVENQANAMAGVLMRNFGKTHDIIYEICIPTLKEIYEVEKSRNIQIYCDMDGVLCDFEKRFEYYYDLPAQQYYKEKGKTAFNDAVDKAGVQFWSNMDWMPGGRELWSIIGKFNPIILTSPSSFKYAKEGKLQLIKNNLNPQPKDVMFAQTGDKYNVIKGKTPQDIKSSILIDDYYPNLAPWKQLGGVGVFHKSIDKTKDILSKFRIQ